MPCLVKIGTLVLERDLHEGCNGYVGSSLRTVKWLHRFLDNRLVQWLYTVLHTLMLEWIKRSLPYIDASMSSFVTIKRLPNMTRKIDIWRP